MSCFISPVVAVLLILPHVSALVDVNSKACTSCYTSVCQDSCLLLTCPLECPQNYYASALTCETPTTTATTTKPTTATTTSTTAKTTTTPTTTTLMTPNVPIANTNETHSAPIAPEQNSLNRSRRQITPEVSTQEQPHLETPETRPAVETTTLTTPTTLLTTPTTLLTTGTTKPTITTAAPSSIVCRRCSVESCDFCQDDSQNISICAKCSDGYSLSNDMSSCSQDGLSGGAIAGIVVGIVCFVAVVVAVSLFLVRRFPWSKEATDPQLARNTSQSFVDDPEQYEIRKLPNAPSPPTEDTSKRYDSLKPTNQDDPQSYSPLEIRKDSRYANCNKSEQPNPYVNTKQKHTTGPSASDKSHPQKKTKEKSVSPNNSELYEEINTTRPNDMQGTYANTKAIQEQLKMAAAAETTPKVYYNHTNDIVEAVYENP